MNNNLPPLPKVGAICYASAQDVLENKPAPEVGTHLPGVRDVALWSTHQMQYYAHAAIAAQAVQLFDFEKQIAERDTRISVLTDAEETLLLLVGLTAFKHEAQRAVLQQAFDGMRAAIAQPNEK